MGAKSTFQQILEEKMSFPEGNSAENDVIPEGSQVFSEGKSPFETLIASLLQGQVNFKFNFSSEHVTDQSRTVRNIYGQPPPREKRQKPRPNEKTILVKDLKAQANQALCTLIELGSTELKTCELLSKSIVQRAFRRLALQLHPDQNPLANGRDFRRAHTAYSVLIKSMN